MDLAAHWDAAYANGDEDRSWYQARPSESLAAIGQVAPDRDTTIVDVGGGSSRLAGELLAAGYRALTVVDISIAALELARGRLGGDAARIEWITADLRDWRPGRRYGVWHDRAVLHFLRGDDERAAYARGVRAALLPGGHAILATFAPEGPEQCSGLPVWRSSADELLELLGPRFTGVETAVRVHTTPSGRRQPFSWLVARLESSP